MGRKRNLALRISQALNGSAPRQCPITTGPRRGTKVLTVPKELRGLVALHHQLVREEIETHWRKRSYDQTEAVQAVELLLRDALKRGGHCPKSTTSVEFHHDWIFNAW